MKIYLDLLPEQRKKELKRRKIFRKILEESILFMLPVFVFIGMLFNVLYILQMQKKAYVTTYSVTAAQDKYQRLSTYEEKFTQANDMVSRLSKIQTNHLYWSEVLKQLSSLMPDGLRIEDFSTKNYKIFLLGEAKTRDDLLNFKNSLESSSCFHEINVPLSNLVVKDNVGFQMDFSIKEECLNKKQL